VQRVQAAAPEQAGTYTAQLLWQRGIRDPETVISFLDPSQYQPTSPLAFGEEVHRAVARLQQAHDQQQQVTIWGDFDADGITATAVLWDGLGQFFDQGQVLSYTIPNRLTESHGLSRQRIERLATEGCQLIVTCDTGSTDLPELRYAQQLGIDVIITDHHTLPETRPPVSAILNPRQFDRSHPLAQLSGVAVAYKLVEALYAALPDVPQRPLEDLLDLVAIGLIADLVDLTGDCRYLAQRGIQRLQAQLQLRTRPGVARLLELCKRSGDRPTDISFGLGPRLNAVSRIHGDASFCVELLTSQEVQRCEQLAVETELANSRRKSLQTDLVKQVAAKLEQLDLSTTPAIVLSDPQWPVGVLGLVAGQIAQLYNRPTLLLSEDSDPPASPNQPRLARGSARSVNQIDLYQVLNAQAHLLTGFGGHPFATGLSLPVANIPLLAEALNQHLRQRGEGVTAPKLSVDLGVTVAELAQDKGKFLFQQLKLLEPCGMGNPVPKLLIQSCWFTQIRNHNIRDWMGHKVQYIKTEFQLQDATTPQGFPGVWWGHYCQEIPTGCCDVVVELDFSPANPKRSQPRYEVRLIAVRPAAASVEAPSPPERDWILDWRPSRELTMIATEREGYPKILSIHSVQPNQATPESGKDILVMTQCPTSWDQVGHWVQQAQAQNQKLAIAYDCPPPSTAIDCWKQLVGIAKYLVRTGETAFQSQLEQRLHLGPESLAWGWQALQRVGFEVKVEADTLKIQATGELPWATHPDASEVIQHFLAAVREEQFLQQYFQAVPVEVIAAFARTLTRKVAPL
jgi:single-stranded-DNA-specific exonuclease